jgi:serine/threonine protein kinase
MPGPERQSDGTPTSANLGTASPYLTTDGAPDVTQDSRTDLHDRRLSRALEDQARHWQAGMTILVETYLQQYPELAQDREAVLAMIRQEIQFFRNRGQSPLFSEYQSRFPSLSDALAAVFATPKPPSDPGESTAPSRLDAASDDTVQRQAQPANAGISPKQLLTRGPRISLPGYEILGELGRGGMGVVYKARQTALKRLVALKMVLTAGHASEEQVARFQVEAQAIARVQHPNIVQVYDIGEHDGQSYLALEYVDGGTLAGKIRGAIPPLQAALMVEPLARAAHVAHQQGVIHRDLKPANILLTSDGTPKISDFGLAKQLDDNSGWTRSGDIMGTPCYMAPEQAEGRVKQIGPATDIYSLGAILYELLTGRPPFRAATTLQTLEMVRTQEPTPPSRVVPQIPRDLETICLKCLEKEPNKRYRSAESLAEDLRRFTTDEPILARPIGTGQRLARWVKRNSLVAALVAMTLLTTTMLVSGFFLFFKPGKSEDDRVAAAQPTEPVVQPKAPVENPPAKAPPVAPPAPPKAPAEPPVQPPEKPKTEGKTEPKKPPQDEPAAVPEKPVPPPEPPKPPPEKTALELVAEAKSAPPEAAIRLYYDAVQKSRRERLTLSPLKRWQQMVEPALALAGKVQHGTDAEVDVRLAALFAEKGRLITSSPYAGWQFKQEPMREAADAYAQAAAAYPPNRRDRTLAEYYTYRGLALTRAKTLPLPEMLKMLDEAAKAATQADANYAGAWNLKGYVLYVQATQPRNAPGFHVVRPADDLLKEALTAYDTAIRLGQSASPPDEKLADYYINRSIALNFHAILTNNVEERRAIMKQSRADAEAAIELRKDDEYAWMAKGIAWASAGNKRLEVLEPKAREEAEAAFQQQIAVRDTLPDGHAALGSLYATWALDEGDTSAKAKAIAALDRALQIDPTHPDANHHRARLHAADKQTEEVVRLARAALATPSSWLDGLARFRSHLREHPKEWRAVLDELLAGPADKFKEEHALVLIERSRHLQNAFPAELESEHPQAVADAETAMKLATNPVLLAQAYEARAGALLRVYLNDKLPKERRIRAAETALKDVDTMLEKDPDHQAAAEWRDRQGNFYFSLAGLRTENADKVKDLTAGIQAAEKAINLYPESSPKRRSLEKLIETHQAVLDRLKM